MSTKTIIPCYRVNAFTKVPFKGNPAIVCYLENELHEDIMQKIAFEMNVSETAFIIPSKNKTSLRWFTPKKEVPICGHGTLAAAYVLFNEYKYSNEVIEFETKSGILTAKKTGQGITLSFPLDEYDQYEPQQQVLDALSLSNYLNCLIGVRTKKLILHLDSSKTVKELKPNFSKLMSIKFKHDVKGLGVTALDNQYDFITRYFNPWAGVNEDPVTGSVHTVLAKYYGDLLNKTSFTAYQSSARGGEMRLELLNKNVVGITGEALILSKGSLFV